jgi:hypothetical protein
VQGARYKVHGTKGNQLNWGKTNISINDGIAVTRVPCTVSHIFQYSIIPEFHHPFDAPDKN